MFERSRVRKLSSRSLPRGTGLAPRRCGAMRGWVTDDAGAQTAKANSHAAHEASPAGDSSVQDAI